MCRVRTRPQHEDASADSWQEELANPEARAALARRRRERALTVAAFTRAKRAFDDDWTRYLAVEVSASVCREAGELAERYRLRGYDAVHLASYLEIARGAGVTGTQFSSFDDRLNRAAATAVRAMARTRRG